ncbi:DNA-binding SARP family transcriptional activator [Streptacidiphilus sp. EB129]
MGERLSFKILGPLTVTAGERAVAIGGARQRTILGMLLIRPGRIVPVEALVDEVWNGRPPATARTQVAIVIAALRKTFRAEGATEEVIVTAHPGYQLHPEGHDVDSIAFGELVERAELGVREQRFADAARDYAQALSLWRGPALAGVSGQLVEDEAARLEECRLNAYDDATAVRLELGNHQELVPELTALVREHPLRERTRYHLMLAQYRSGRRAEAMENFRDARRQFIDELGLVPGPVLQELHEAILRDDPALSPAPAPSRRAALPVDVVAAAPDELPPPEVTVVPSELPPDVPGFTGRESELAALDHLIAEQDGQLAPTVGLITGVAGVGKTGLAVRWAHRVAEDFPDGRLFADLRGYDELHEPTAASEVLSRFLRSLGVPSQQIPAGVEERVALYRSVLADRRVLVVLDNVRTFAQIRPLLPGSGASCVLGTSREQLEQLVTWPAQARVHLGMLPEEEATELLCRIVGEQRIRTARVDAARLAELCDRLPLALRIAGARLASKPHWTVRHLVTRLSDERRRLDELSQGESQVRASFALSYRFLSRDAAKLYRCLGLLDVPDFTAWTGAALLDTGVMEAEQLIEHLVDAQFLEVVGIDATGQFRYRLQNLLRLYAGERAREEEPESDRLAACDRVFRTCLAIAEEAHRREYGGDYSVVHSAAARRPIDSALLEELLAAPLEWYEAERLSLRAVVLQAARTGLADLAWDLTGSMIGLFETRNYTDDWRSCAEQALAAAVSAGDTLGQGVMRYHLGAVQLRLQRFEDAVAELDAALGLYQAAGSELGRAMTLRNLAIVDRVRGDWGTAMGRLEEALAVFRALGDRFSEAHTLNNMAQVQTDQGRPGLALELAEEAVRIGEGMGEDGVRNLAQSVHRLARAYLALDRFESAEAAFQRVAAISKGKSDLMGLSYALLGQGEARLGAGTPESAEAVLVEALEIARRMGSQLIEGQTQLVFGEMCGRLGREAEARTNLLAARDVFVRVGAPQWRDRAEQALTALVAAAPGAP